MDFEFVTDVTGQPLAKCDIESEAFGDWLSHDLGTNTKAISDLLLTVDGLLAKRAADAEITGKIYHLVIADDEVDLFLNNTELSGQEFEEEFSDGPVAGCGLVEFKHLLQSWLEFIQ
ncbi:YacL family protein [Alteromonas lipolytica]|uniref:Uncharacterized protein n=1 Tax=Alteromonas lipolytica TaxID=1856405 RepID=A0A1E8FGW6_9ALTE|nr:YacL family protein [Alteromonas lipolytica]OFI35185.1 hypothetical protein BFC17_16720 [Alteromonas lipolytica]GGF57439.1 hypothetical protein GCM10011338_07100 [Alteromonas lipolytica]